MRGEQMAVAVTTAHRQAAPVWLWLRSPGGSSCPLRAAHAGLGRARLVLSEVSTLYFDLAAGDGLREPGLSRKRQLESQITIGLRTHRGELPLMQRS